MTTDPLTDSKGLQTGLCPSTGPCSWENNEVPIVFFPKANHFLGTGAPSGLSNKKQKKQEVSYQKRSRSSASESLERVLRVSREKLLDLAASNQNPGIGEGSGQSQPEIVAEFRLSNS